MGILDQEATPPQSSAAQWTDIFVPEFLSSNKKKHTIRPATSWLDGLRGCAALCVTFMHLTVYTHDGIELCYGSKFNHNDEHNLTPAALPIIRLPFTGGHFSVMLFFVISGYVVPRRLVSYLQGRGGTQEEFWLDIQSAMVRRPIRLYLPVFISTLTIALLWQLLGIKPESIPKQANLIAEMYAWSKETLLFSYFYRYGWLYSYYNVHTWTIPIELRGSMFLFVYLIMVSGINTKSRIYMTLCMVIYLSVLTPGAWKACFFAGMFLCEVDMLGTDSTIRFFWSDLSDWLSAKHRQAIRAALMHIIFIIALYLATQPNSDWSTRAETLGNCPGWKTLSWLIPSCYFDADSQFRWYWLFWAAALMVFVIREINWLKSIFETPTAQYLGRHSFALYLIHGPMIQYFSDNLFYMTGVKTAWSELQKAKFDSIQNALCDQPWWPLPKGGPAGLEPNFLFCCAVSIPIFLYVAEVGTKIFDTPSINASKYVWKRWRGL